MKLLNHIYDQKQKILVIILEEVKSFDIATILEPYQVEKEPSIPAHDLEMWKALEEEEL